MFTKLKVGDSATLKSAILFGLETYLKHHLGNHPDFPVTTIAWGRESFGQDEARNALISFIEPPKPGEIPETPKGSHIRKYEWSVFIQGMLPDNHVYPTLPAYEMCGELKRLLIELEEKSLTGSAFGAVNNLLNLGPKVQTERGFNSNLSEMSIGSETVRGPGEHSSFAFFWLPVYFSITEDLKHPRVTVQNPL